MDFTAYFLCGTDYTTTSIFALNDGELFGFTSRAAEYTGTYKIDPIRNLVRFEVTATLDPGVLW